MASPAFRVTYINQLDGERRVLVGALSMEQAIAVKAKFGDKREAFTYMGPGVEIGFCDGTADGEIVRAKEAA
jgi:hypothetical protein